MTKEQKNQGKPEKAGVKGYIALAFAICFFSGAFADAPGPLRILDFTTIMGTARTIIEGTRPGFAGIGESGVMAGFTHTLSIAPGVWLAVAVISVVDYLGGLRAAQELLTPILRPIMGVPGNSALAIISNWQSSDTGAAILKDFLERGLITENERDILVAYQFSAAACVGMYFSNGAMVFPYLTKPIGIGILLIMILKFVGANIMRLHLKKEKKKSNKEIAE